MMVWGIGGNRCSGRRKVLGFYDEGKIGDRDCVILKNVLDLELITTYIAYIFFRSIF